MRPEVLELFRRGELQERHPSLARQVAAAILGVEQNAAPDEVRRAYRRQQHALHPDRRPDDREAAERFILLDPARDFLLSPPPVPPPPVPQTTRYERAEPSLVSLSLAGEQAWRGGHVVVHLPDGRPGVLLLPPAVELGALLPIELERGQTWGRVDRIDLSPWRGDVDERGRRRSLDLSGTLEVSLHDLLAGATVAAPTPWGDVDLRLPARSLAPLRIRGHGLRPPAGPPGHLLVDLRIGWPEENSLLLLALREQRRPPRVVP